MLLQQKHSWCDLCNPANFSRKAQKADQGEFSVARSRKDKMDILAETKKIFFLCLGEYPIILSYLVTAPRLNSASEARTYKGAALSGSRH